MSDRFEDDLMEDLMAEPEGRSGHSPMDEFDAADEEDAADEFDEFDELDEAEDSGDEPMEPFEGEDPMDELEEDVTDALEAEDADEFFGSFKNILKKVGRAAGSIARRVAPIAKMIPIPQAQLIGRAADLIGGVLADEGDEMDALEELADFADEEDGFDPLAPAMAGLAIRGALKHTAARIPREQRKQLVKAVSAVTKHLAHTHGPRAVIAVPGVVRTARKIAARKGLSTAQLPHIVKRAGRAAIRSPRLLRKFARAGAKLRTGRSAYRTAGVRRFGRTRYGYGGYVPRSSMQRGLAPGKSSAGGYAPGYGPSGRFRTFGVGGAPHAAYCPTCRRRSFSLRGPVRVTIESP
jgi:hypothetical protein